MLLLLKNFDACISLTATSAAQQSMFITACAVVVVLLQDSEVVVDLYDLRSIVGLQSITKLSEFYFPVIKKIKLY